MAFQRRRHHYYLRLQRLIPFISALSAVLLILFALLSFLAPSPVDSVHLRHRSFLKIRNDDAVGISSFRVPSGEGKSARDLWSSRNYKFYYGCSNASKKFQKVEAITHPNRYLAIATSGGLNQQRTGITDAVVAARILNATLVVPKLDQKSFWKDSSNFSEIFDVDWFISFLSKDVKIIQHLPRKGGETLDPYTMRVPRKCSERCYESRVLPVLLERHAVQLTKFDYRLANKLGTDLQKLRCRVNYHALRFIDPILHMGEKLVRRMKMKGKHYIALHLRMLLWWWRKGKERTGCNTEEISNPEKERRHGKCPLTPEEVGLMLRALGYGSDVHIYVASGEVYGGEETLAPLKALFPNFYSKETIATKEELEPFSSFSSRMAALDFIVCDESDVFVTNNNGNMARILAGRRRYFGHKPSIRPNAKKLYRLFLSRNNMTWETFASRVRTFQRGFMGEPKEVRPGRGEFHENPSTCICEDSDAKAERDSGPRKHGKGHYPTRKDVVIDVQNLDDEPEWLDMDDNEDRNEPLERGLFNRTVSDFDGAISDDDPDLEEILSD
ncbi:hypothetical protein F2P56_018232 [Juglans regia]|uniref:O-fucosyltransferase family protein n=1 Tax=Juglans regia TaxID=51240 RepID=A0A833XAT0_JUGRE|nr:hypothetical protein F2P56_018232 [Juglans regia]